MNKLIILFILTISLQAKSTLYYIQKYSDKYRIDSRVVQALIKVESQGKLNAISRKGAIGIAQIMPDTSREYYKYRWKKYREKFAYFWWKAPSKLLISHIKIESVNIQICTWYLRQCLNAYNGNYILTLNSYINGIQGAKENESWNYINDIIDNIIRFKE